jgi:hypothetical protein
VAQRRVPSDVSAEETRGASTQGEGPPCEASSASRTNGWGHFCLTGA